MEGREIVHSVDRCWMERDGAKGVIVLQVLGEEEAELVGLERVHPELGGGGSGVAYRPHRH